MPGGREGRKGGLASSPHVSKTAGAIANPVSYLLSDQQAVDHADDGDGQHRDDDHHGKGPHEDPRDCRTPLLVSARPLAWLQLTPSQKSRMSAGTVLMTDCCLLIAQRRQALHEKG